MVSMRVTVMAATLVALCVLATNTHADYIFCCRRYIPWKIPFSEIKGFSVQRSTVLCPINAIIFHTNKGKRCADPTQKWVMDYVSFILSGRSVAPKGDQKPKPQPKQSFTAAPDKIITDGPPPVKLCKW